MIFIKKIKSHYGVETNLCLYDLTVAILAQGTSRVKRLRNPLFKIKNLDVNFVSILIIVEVPRRIVILADNSRAFRRPVIRFLHILKKHFIVMDANCDLLICICYQSSRELVMGLTAGFGGIRMPVSQPSSTFSFYKFFIFTSSW